MARGFLGIGARRVLYFWHTVRQPLPHAPLEHVHQPEPDRYGDVLQDVPARVARGAGHRAKTALGSSRRSRAKLAQRDLRFYEVGISYHGRTYAEGKKIGWKDGINAIRCITRYSKGRYKDVGRQTLQRLETFEEYGEWIYGRVQQWLGAKVIEAGSGIGSLGKKNDWARKSRAHRPARGLPRGNAPEVPALPGRRDSPDGPSRAG